jgi:signal transduction histidine kinase
VLYAEGEWSGELQQVHQDGSTLSVRARARLLRGPDGKPESVLIVNTDITEQKRLEAQLLRAQRLDSIGTLAGGIAHDLNNVLQPILMAIDVLGDDTLPAEDRRNYLRMLSQNAHRGADLVRQVLTFARGTRGERLPVRLQDVLREVHNVVRETFPRAIAVSLELPKELPPVAADPTQLHQVITNLCVNARDAMPGGGLLELQAEVVWLDEAAARAQTGVEAGRYLVVRVADTGTGMTPQVQERIFEPFFTTKGPNAGTGLGLSTTLSIVRSHGGFLRVQSAPGKGSTFEVWLPAAAEPGPPVAPAPRPPRIAGEGQRLLLVDDEGAIREITRAALEGSGYQVMTARNGIEGMALYMQHGAELAAVLTDWMMPQGDGPALLRFVQERNPAARLLVMSGLPQDVGPHLVKGARPVQLMQKPYTAEQLLAALADLLA